MVKKIKENLKGAENGPKNLEKNQLNSRKNRKRGPERVFKETKLINGGKFQIVKCAEFGIERSTKQIRKSSGGGGNTANFNFKKPTNERIPSAMVKMAGKPTSVKLERMPQSTKSDSLDVFSTKPSKNIVENSVEVESVDFVLVDKSTLSLENNVEEMGSHHKKKSSGKAKRKRTSLEGSQENAVKSPKKLGKGGKLENLCPNNLNCASSTTEGGGRGGLVMEKLKLFGNFGNRTTNSTSLYEMKGVKKTYNIFEKAKLGNKAKQTGEPMKKKGGGKTRLGAASYSPMVGGFED